MTEPTIRPALATEIPAVGELIAISFDDLAPNAYLVPPPSERVPVLAASSRCSPRSRPSTAGST